MKQFLSRLLLFFFIVILVLFVGFFLPATPKSKSSLIHARKQKEKLLEEESSKRRVIFIGGSNVSLGLNCEMIEDSLPLKPINTAIQAGVGLVYMMDHTLRYVREGDIIVLIPEYEQYSSLAFGSSALFRMIADHNPTEFIKLRKEQLLRMPKYFVRYSFSKYNPFEYFMYSTDEVYGSNSFNAYGDVYTHWYMAPQIITVSKTLPPLDYRVFNKIKSFKEKLEKRGASLFVSFPGYQDSSYDSTYDEVKEIYGELQKGNYTFLGTPETFKMPHKYMFNSVYHLVKEGVDYRTSLVIEELGKQLYTNNKER